MFSTTPHISSFAPYCDECPLRRTGVDDPTLGGNWLPCRCEYHTVCQHCGWPITDDAERSDHQGLCAVCAWEDLTWGRPPEERHELPALLAALGLPPDTSVTFHLLHGVELDDDWVDYRIEWALLPDVAWRYPPTGQVISHPWRIQLPGWNAPRVILRWRQWRWGEPAFLERTWRRDGPRWAPREQVRAIDGLPSRSAVDEFTRLLGEQRAGGRKPDDLERWLETTLRPAITRTIAVGQRPDQRAVGADRPGALRPEKEAASPESLPAPARTTPRPLASARG